MSRSEWIARREGPIVTQMHFARKGIVTEEMEFVARAGRARPRAGAERGRARPDGHPGERPAPRARADGDRHREPLQDQREHRHLRRHLVARRGGRQAPALGPLRRGHGDGPLDRAQDPRSPRGDHPRLAASRSGRFRSTRSSSAAGKVEAITPRADPRRDRGPGAAGRRLHDDPRRDPSPPPAARRGPRHRDRLARRVDPRAVDDVPPRREPALHALRRDLRDLPPLRRHVLSRRLASPGLAPRRLRRGAVRRARHARRADAARVGARRPGDGRRAPATSRWTRST